MRKQLVLGSPVLVKEAFRMKTGVIAAATAVCAAYLTYDGSDESDLRVYARFFTDRSVIEIEGDTEYFYSDGSLYGREWER